jgi:hypothetical protein
MDQSKFSIQYINDYTIHLDSLAKTSASTIEEINNEYLPYQISDLQNYNPILGKFFEINTNDATKSYALNHKYHIQDLNTVINIDTKEVISKEVFVKFSPLLDPIRYMIGKYKQEEHKIRVMPTFHNSMKCHPKIIDPNNAAYTDSFFSYLTSQLLNRHGFVHGIDYYGTAIGVQAKYKMNVTDDLEYLNSSTYFTENTNKLFTISDFSEDDFTNFGSRRNKNRIQIANNEIDISPLLLDDIEVLDTNDMNELAIEDELLQEYEKKDSNENDDSSSMSSTSSDSSNNSELNYSSSEEDNPDNEDNDEEDDDDNEDNDEEDDDDNEDDDEKEEEENERDQENALMNALEGDNDEWQTESSSESSEIERFAYIKDFPVQLICLEKCQGTLDELFEKNKMNHTLAASALFQIVMILLSYQKSFHFTHNDLHTNNIMYNNTDIENLYYKYKNVVYKVPTYGKIFKLIDFGRSIYRFNGQIFCSDSFAVGGDAATQYNCEPYLNEKKARLDPNYSFDLCRLGCSIYDFIIEDEANVDVENLDPLQETIYRWCLDNSGKNILYKKNGEERYPNFKLYKMIARSVHNNRPDQQFDYPYFNQFATTESFDSTLPNNIDIDSLPVYV